MSSPKFERVKQSNPGIAGLLDKLVAYIEARVHAGQSFIVPKLVAAALGLNDGEAFVLLEILAANDLLRRVYNLYCRRTGVLLATVGNPEHLDDIPHCDECDDDHTLSDFKVEVAFTPNELLFDKVA